MIIFTDIGKDVDDAVAITYAIVKDLPIQAVVTTSKDSVESAKIVKNILEFLKYRYPKAQKISVYMGSSKGTKKKTFHGNTYKGEFSQGSWTFPKYDPELLKKDDVVSLGPLTDVLGALEKGKVKRIMFMGQPEKDGSSLKPDMAAYNFKEDPFASEAVFQYQDKVPFGFITKYLAYKCPLTFPDMDQVENTGHQVGRFLKDHALRSFDFFKENVKELYERVYKGTNNLSYCYDPLTILAMVHPGLFIFEKFGPHRIGAAIEPRAKEVLLKELVQGLSVK